MNVRLLIWPRLLRHLLPWDRGQPLLSLLLLDRGHTRSLCHGNSGGLGSILSQGAGDVRNKCTFKELRFPLQIPKPGLFHGKCC